jgi:hypothetical protein
MGEDERDAAEPVEDEHGNAIPPPFSAGPPGMDVTPPAEAETEHAPYEHEERWHAAFGPDAAENREPASSEEEQESP